LIILPIDAKKVPKISFTTKTHIQKVIFALNYWFIWTALNQTTWQGMCWHNS